MSSQYACLNSFKVTGLTWNKKGKKFISTTFLFYFDKYKIWINNIDVIKPILIVIFILYTKILRLLFITSSKFLPSITKLQYLLPTRKFPTNLHEMPDKHPIFLIPKKKPVNVPKYTPDCFPAPCSHGIRRRVATPSAPGIARTWPHIDATVRRGIFFLSVARGRQWVFQEYPVLLEKRTESFRRQEEIVFF